MAALSEEFSGPWWSTILELSNRAVLELSPWVRVGHVTVHPLSTVCTHVHMEQSDQRRASEEDSQTEQLQLLFTLTIEGLTLDQLCVI